MPPTALVSSEKVVVIDPPSIVTVAGAVTGSPAVTCTTAPPDGAGASSVTRAITGWPPTMVVVLKSSEARVTTGPAVTVSIGESFAVPFSDAVIVAVPAASASTVNVPLEAPEAIVIAFWTVAVMALLLERSTLSPAAGAGAVSVTVPTVVAPAATLVEVSETLDTVTIDVGLAGEFDPH